MTSRHLEDPAPASVDASPFDCAVCSRRTGLACDRDRYRDALTHLMEFGKKLMASDDEGERGIGCCICKGARVVEDG